MWRLPQSSASRRTAGRFGFFAAHPETPFYLFMSTTCTGGRTFTTGAQSVITLWVEEEILMRLDAEKAAIAVMTFAIAGVGPVCVALLLLL